MTGSSLPKSDSERFQLDHVLVELCPENKTFGLSALEPGGERATSILFSGFLKPEMAGELRRLADRIDQMEELSS